MKRRAFAAWVPTGAADENPAAAGAAEAETETASAAAGGKGAARDRAAGEDEVAAPVSAETRRSRRASSLRPWLTPTQLMHRSLLLRSERFRRSEFSSAHARFSNAYDCGSPVSVPFLFSVARTFHIRIQRVKLLFRSRSSKPIEKGRMRGGSKQSHRAKRRQVCMKI